MKKTFLLGLLLSLNLSFSAFASEYTDLTNSLLIDFNNSINTIKTIDFEDNKLNIDTNGNIILGWSIDKDGDLCYTRNIIGPGLSSQDLNISNLDSFSGLGFGMLKNDSIDDYKFDNNGKLINPGIDYNNKFLSNMLELETTGKTYVEAKPEVGESFLDFRLLDSICPMYINRINDFYEFSINQENMYNREDLKKEILYYYGGLSGDTPYEKIVAMCEKLKSMNYNSAFTPVTIRTSLYYNQGVCFHFATIAKVVLQNEGLDVETFSCKFKNADGNHLIIRTKVDGKWVYSDPSFYSQNGNHLAIIPYDILINTYEPTDYNNFSWENI